MWIINFYRNITQVLIKPNQNASANINSEYHFNIKYKYNNNVILRRNKNYQEKLQENEM